MLELYYKLLDCFNVDIMMLYISSMNHARKLKISSYVYLRSISNIFPYRNALSDSVQCRREVIMFEHVCYISALEHIRMLI